MAIRLFYYTPHPSRAPVPPSHDVRLAGALLAPLAGRLGADLQRGCLAGPHSSLDGVHEVLGVLHQHRVCLQRVPGCGSLALRGDSGDGEFGGEEERIERIWRTGHLDGGDDLELRADRGHTLAQVEEVGLRSGENEFVRLLHSDWLSVEGCRVEGQEQAGTSHRSRQMGGGSP
jgi:hypothetical protein